VESESVISSAAGEERGLQEVKQKGTEEEETVVAPSSYDSEVKKAG
jgi:hypothetical protein